MVSVQSPQQLTLTVADKLYLQRARDHIRWFTARFRGNLPPDRQIELDQTVDYLNAKLSAIHDHLQPHVNRLD